MPRPISTGLEFFPLATVMNERIADLEDAEGLTGFAVYIKLLQLIYRTERAELTISDARLNRYARTFDITQEELQGIIDTLLLLGLLDKEAYDKKLLTSPGIKKRFEQIQRERERKRKWYERKSGGSSEPQEDSNETDNGRLKPVDMTESSEQNGTKERKGKKRKGEETKSSTDQEQEHPLQSYIRENLPNVYGLKRQMDFSECEKILSEFPADAVYDVLHAMENKRTLQKDYMRVYLTCRNWLLRRTTNDGKQHIQTGQTDYQKRRNADVSIIGGNAAKFANSD